MGMIDESILNTLRTMIRVGCWTLLATSVSLVLAMCKPFFLNICKEIMAAGASGRDRCQAGIQQEKNSVGCICGWYFSDWLPIRRLAHALETIGERSIGKLEYTASLLSSNLSKYSALKTQFSVPDAITTQEFSAGVQNSFKFGSTFIVTTLIALMAVPLNTYLLHLFFASSFSDTLVTRIPFSIYTSTVIAMLLSAFEVAAGINLHYFEDTEQKQSGVVTTMKYGSWFLILSLMVIEIIAYSTMSVNMEIAEKLSISPESDLYGFLRYFFGLFGAAITMSLMTVGYVSWETLQKYAASQNMRWTMSKWNKANLLLSKMKDSAKAIDTSCKFTLLAIEKLPADISLEFRRITKENEDVAASVKQLREKIDGWKQQSGGVQYPHHPLIAALGSAFLVFFWYIGLMACSMLEGITFASLQLWKLASILGDAFLSLVRPNRPTTHEA